MDALLQACSQFLQLTVSPHENHRKEAEVQYAKYAQTKGFSAALFHISIQTDVPTQIRQMAAIFLKNQISAAYQSPNGDLEEEYNFIKTNLIQAMVSVPSEIRAQFCEVFRILADLYFPSKWDDLLPKIIYLLKLENSVALDTAMDCLLVLVKKYTFKLFGSAKGKILASVIEATFPTLLTIFSKAIPIHCEHLDGINLQIKICKYFFLCTRSELPLAFLGDTFVEWFNLFQQLFIRPVKNQPESLSDRLTFPPWQVKKWAIKILYQIYNNYVTGFSDELAEKFSTQFRNVYAIQVQQLILKELAQIAAGTGYLHPRIVTTSIKFLSTSIKFSISYKTLKPHLTSLLQDVIFHILFFSNEDQESFEEDPEDYIRNEFDAVFEYYSPKKNAETFLSELFTQRSRSNLLIFMQFIINRLNNYQQAQEKNYAEKYACLSVLCTLSKSLKTLQEFNQGLEQMLGTYILPEFTSPKGFIRAIACWTFSIYSDLQFNNSDLFLECLKATFGCLNDQSLPVRVTAAISLRPIVQHNLAQEIVRQNLEKLFEIYLNLVNEIDNEEVISATEFLISKYQNDIAPFSVKLLQAFIKSFIRVVSSEEEEEDSANITGWECLKAITLVLKAIKNHPNIYVEISPMLIQPIAACFNENFIEFIEDFLRIISFLVCHSPTISNELWNLAPIIASACNEWAIDFLPEILICFDNLICIDTPGFVQRNYIELIISIYNNALREGVEDKNQKPAAQLIETAIQNSSGSAEKFIPIILKLTINRIKAGQFEGTSLPILLFNIIGTCLFFYTKITVLFLQEGQYLDFVITAWFQLFPHLTRIYDRKVIVLGLVSLFNLSANELPPFILQQLKNITTNSLLLLNDIQRLRAEKEAKQPAQDGLFVDVLSPLEVRKLSIMRSTEDDEYDSDDDIIVPAQKSNDDNFTFGNFTPIDSLENEDQVITAIDSIQELLFFFNKIEEFSTREPQLCQSLFSSFSSEENEILRNLSQLREQIKSRNQ